jgi:hypothetical protein
VAVIVVAAAVLIVLWAAWRGRWVATRSGREARAARIQAASLPSAPRFRLDHVSTHRYVLRNDGGSTAYDVHVDTGQLVVQEGSVVFDEFPPRGAEKYLLIQPLHGRMSEITVRWRDRPGHPEQHADQLPLATRVTSPQQLPDN